MVQDRAKLPPEQITRPRAHRAREAAWVDTAYNPHQPAPKDR